MMDIAQLNLMVRRSRTITNMLFELETLVGDFFRQAEDVDLESARETYLVIHRHLELLQEELSCTQLSSREIAKAIVRQRERFAEMVREA